MKDYRGCIGFVRANAPISKAIMLQAQWQGIPKEYRVSHMFHVVDCNVIHEANLICTQPKQLDKYLNPEFEMWLFRNSNLTPENYTAGKKKSETLLYKPYDFPGILSFVIKKIRPLKWAWFCSEFSSFIVRKYWKLQLCPDILAENRITPSMSFFYSDWDGKYSGWEKVAYWNGKMLIEYPVN